MIQNTVILLFFIIALGGCSEGDRKVVLSDKDGTRTLTYEYGKGFIPQAKVPDDVPVLIYSMNVVMSEAYTEKDILTAQTLQKAIKEKDFRTIERTVVEFRFRQVQQGKK
jgi:hypothetical protein